MNNFFNLDNGLFTFLGKVCDVLLLSLLWIVVCIPIITIGPANTALYYATVKVIRGERGYLFREFFRSFKLNFKRAAIIGIILTIIGVILGMDILTAWTSITASASLNSILLGIYLSFMVFYICIATYIFPLLSRFDMTVKQLFKAAAFMSLKHLPYTFLMLLVVMAAMAGIYFMPVAILIIPATVTFINSLLIERLFKIYMPKEEVEGEMDDAEGEPKAEATKETEISE